MERRRRRAALAVLVVCLLSPVATRDAVDPSGKRTEQNKFGIGVYVPGFGPGSDSFAPAVNKQL